MALIKLSTPIPDVQWKAANRCSARLPGEDACSDGTLGYFMGWGLREDGVILDRPINMNQGKLKISSAKNCVGNPGDHKFCVRLDQNDKYRTCPGDSGSALLSGGRVVLGIQSNGFIDLTEGKASCPEKEPASVFTNLCHQSVQEFLKNNLPEDVYTRPPEAKDVFEGIFEEYINEPDVIQEVPMFFSSDLKKGQTIYLLLLGTGFCAFNLLCWLTCTLFFFLKSLSKPQFTGPPI